MGLSHREAATEDIAQIIEELAGDGAREHFYDHSREATYPVVSGSFDEITRVRETALALGGEADSPEEKRARVAGRITNIRLHSNYGFIGITDQTGASIQVIVPRKERAVTAEAGELNVDECNSFLSASRVGSIVLVDGLITQSRSGEPSISPGTAPQLLAPAYIAQAEGQYTPPDQTEEAKRFEVRSKMKSSIRRSLEGNGFVEVVTPVLSAVPSGANAEVFTSRIAALEREAYLRISPELALKTAIVNGYAGRVYEFATNFRNEGIDREHSPEFEMLEFYSSYTTAAELQDFTASTIREATTAALGTTRVELEKEDGTTLAVDLGNWGEASYRDLIFDKTGLDLDVVLDLPEPELKNTLLHTISEYIDPDDFSKYAQLSAASIIDKLFKFTCRPYIDNPTFVKRYPAIMVPLARPIEGDTNYVDMFQGIVGSLELIKGYQELTNPLTQLANLRRQAAAKEAGDTESMTVDWEYISTMLKGLPPTAGCGIGIDRLSAILNGTKNIHLAMPYPFKDRFSNIRQ